MPIYNGPSKTTIFGFCYQVHTVKYGEQIPGSGVAKTQD